MRKKNHEFSCSATQIIWVYSDSSRVEHFPERNVHFFLSKWLRLFSLLCCVHGRAFPFPWIPFRGNAPFLKCRCIFHPRAEGRVFMNYSQPVRFTYHLHQICNKQFELKFLCEPYTSIAAVIEKQQSTFLLHTQRNGGGGREMRLNNSCWCAS